MKDVLKKYMLPALCVGIVLAVYVLSESGKENVLRAMGDALEKAIDVDFYYRSKQEMKSAGYNQLVKKVKNVEIIGENGREIVELKDSVDEYIADRMSVQYILAKIHPVAPDEFNAIFRKELEKRGFSYPTGIVYRYNGKAQYSGQDSLTLQKAVVTPVTPLDVKNTATVQAWAHCGRWAVLRHAGKMAWGGVAFLFVAFVSAGCYTLKKKDNALPRCPEITIDEKKQKICIGGKECVTTKMGFRILALLVREPDCFVTREQIVQELWPEEKEQVDAVHLHNRMDGHINALRKSLCDFTGCRLETVKGKGYRLSVRPD